jgi:hypothetical protein
MPEIKREEAKEVPGGSEGGAGAAAAPAPEGKGFVVRALQPHPPGTSYDHELEHLCRVAASAGGVQAAPLSYTALVIAFLYGSDEVSKWFQAYVTKMEVHVDEIFRSKSIKPEDRERHIARASSGQLPDVDPLFSRSVKNVMEQAARIARDVSKTSAAPLLAPRHVMAAYAFRNPSDHKDQVRGWGFQEDDWRKQFLQFAKNLYPAEDWEKLTDSAPRPFIEMVSSFTSDDPLAPVRDCFGAKDEAAAFARILASTAISPPLAIGIFGEWGSGKTFFMRSICENVEALTKRARSGSKLFHSDIVQIKFNAWHYIETNLWASLVEHIFSELDRWLLGKAQDERRMADLVFNRLATAQQLKLDALEDLVARRSERRSAEIRAEKARQDYEAALARSSAFGAGAYLRALMETFLERSDVKADLEKIGKDLGAPEMIQDAGRVMQVLEQARTDEGRAKLILRSGIARLGASRWIATAVVLLVGMPLLAVGLKNLVAWITNSNAIRSIQETVLALSGLAAGAAAAVGALVRQASKVVDQIDTFDKKLSEQVTNQVKQTEGSDVTRAKLQAEDELRKRRQAMEAAERALADAEAKLTATRQDFESATARSRLNAFIRAKATEGDYAKHLGIIAAIRRDFGQLAALMLGASDPSALAESDRVANEARAGVIRFLDWLKEQPDVRLTPGEVRSLLSLLDPEKLGEVLAPYVQLLKGHMEGSVSELESIELELKPTASQMPKFSRIILYIDDLDRCPDDTVVRVLQAVHLLLSFPLFTVVVAVDARWISRALRDQFPGLLMDGTTSTASASATTHDYLEKIFQIPYWVRPIDPAGAQEFVNSLLEPDVRRVATPGTPAPPVAPELTLAYQSPSPLAAPASAQPATGTAATSTADGAQDAAGLEITRWEADALARFAPFVSSAPRRLIRFTNVYRLIRTSLPRDVMDHFVGEKGESYLYRALITQLAIVTGVPGASMQYLRMLQARDQKEAISDLIRSMTADATFKTGDPKTALDILIEARSWLGEDLKMEHLTRTARFAFRYSFTGTY